VGNADLPKTFLQLLQAFDDSMNLPLMHKMCTLDWDSYLAFEEFEACDN